MNLSVSEDLPLNHLKNETLIVILQTAMIVPEYFNLVFLLLGIYGMYQGIEIQHPLYAMIFLNLIVALFFTLLDLAVFFFLSTDRFVSILNASSTVALFFHCTCWCVTSIIRYLYIVHENWIHSVLPSLQSQRFLAFGFTFILFLTLTSPPLGYGIYLGKNGFMVLCLVIKSNAAWLLVFRLFYFLL
jgi:hypothetical protein